MSSLKTKVENWLFDQRRRHAYGTTWTYFVLYIVNIGIIAKDFERGIQFLGITVLLNTTIGYMLERRGTHQREQERNTVFNPYFQRNDKTVQQPIPKNCYHHWDCCPLHGRKKCIGKENPNHGFFDNNGKKRKNSFAACHQTCCPWNPGVEK